MTKSFHLLLGVLFFFVSINICAQEAGLSSGKAPFSKTRSHVQYGTFSLADIAYANDNDNSNNISMPIPAGTPFTTIGSFTAPNFAASMVKGGDDNFYLIDVAPALYLFDPSIGTCTLIGNITGMNGDQPNGISYNPANNQYYMVSSSAFYSLDINTLQATLIGSFSITGLMIDLCFDENGVCYSYEVNTTPGAANGYIIDISTGALTTLGYLGFTPNYGQGMSYDMETHTIYLSAFNYDTYTGQLRTMDKTNGSTNLIYDWGDQIAAFAVDTHYGPPCPVEAASNPNPANGAVDVAANLSQLTWDNGTGAVSNELYFGTDPSDLTLKQSGTLATSWTLDTQLLYSTNYYWKVVEIGDTCNSSAQVWTFKTMQDPNLITLFSDDFENGTGNYTISTVSGCPWQIFTDPTITSRYTLPATAGGGILAADADHCGSGGGGSSSTIQTNSPIDATSYQSVAIEWDNDWQAIGVADFAYLDVSVDGGATWSNVITWNDVDIRDTHEYHDISSLVGTHSFLFRFVSVQPAWDWWWAVDNIKITGWDIIPVELTSFRADAIEGNVTLNWSTATETNNKGFEIQKNSGAGYQVIDFVQGYGTSTQNHNYSFVDKNVTSGNYTYRLKQVDFNGSSNYSNTVEVNVNVPKVYSLQQNYPNPFNPTTRINFNLATDAKVTLRVFNILGQEITTLLNGNMTAGQHIVNFDASHLNSGVYMYKIEANGVDGSRFTSVKKMVLTK